MSVILLVLCQMFRLPLTRELSAKLTEGEKNQILLTFIFSPSVFCSAKSTSLIRGRQDKNKALPQHIIKSVWSYNIVFNW